MTTPEEPTHRETMKLAPYGRRVGGYLLDGVIIGGGYLVAIVIFASSRVPLLGLLLGVALAIVYPWLMIAFSQGQTLGMKAVKVKCVDAKTGKVPSAGKALGRTFGAILCNIIFFVGWLDLLWPAWDQKRQTLHDKMAGTLVVDVGIAPNTTVTFG